MKKVCASLMCVALLVVFSSDVFAAASWREGKKTYRSVCTSCHKSRNEAGRLSLDSRTRDEWSAFFAQDPGSIHKTAWDKLDKGDIESLEMYFRKYAKDVVSLIGCG